MTGIPWFEQVIPFHYNHDEESKIIKKDLSEDSGIFLEAIDENSDELLGVLGMTVKEKRAYIRPWEPAVTPMGEKNGADRFLMERAISILRSMGVKEVKTTFKFINPTSPTTQRLIRLYRQYCEIESQSIQLLCDLDEGEIKYNNGNIEIRNGEEIPIERFTDISVRSFAHTREDREIHGLDGYTQDREQNLRLHKIIREGTFGISTPDCWKVALLDGEMAGAAICFIPQSDYHPPHGVLGELGVMPEFRRRGVGSALIRAIHETMIDHGCKYSYVGTPLKNTRAIRLYEKCGYRQVFYLYRFEWRL